MIPSNELRYHHVGIPTTDVRADETHLPEYGLHVSGFDESLRCRVDAFRSGLAAPRAGSMLGLAASVACWAPARAALRMEASSVLREE